MTEVTFDGLPKAVEYLIGVVEDLAKALKEKEETPAAQADKWMNLDELIAYLPDRPAKSTVYNCNTSVNFYRKIKVHLEFGVMGLCVQSPLTISVFFLPS